MTVNSNRPNPVRNQEIWDRCIGLGWSVGETADWFDISVERVRSICLNINRHLCSRARWISGDHSSPTPWRLKEIRAPHRRIGCTTVEEIRVARGDATILDSVRCLSDQWLKKMIEDEFTEIFKGVIDMSTEHEGPGGHPGLPVKGYKPQSQDNVDMVNEGKELEERVLRWLDDLHMNEAYDARMVAIARTNIQTGFMWAARSVFQPDRFNLDGGSTAAVPSQPEA